MGSQKPRIALIGGGTGSFTLLQALKKLTPNISAIVNMSDDGGSTGVLRDELGVLPPGDVRQCLVALSNMPEAREVFDFRFPKGRFENQSLGNIILSGLELKYESFDEAVKVASKLLHVVGEVIPVTFENHQLVIKDGVEEIVGEHLIGHRPIKNHDAKISLRPKSNVNPAAKAAIEKADVVVIAPGNLYGSILPALAVDGVATALQKTNAIKVLVCNLVTKPGQTDGWHVVDYVKKIEEYIAEGSLDYVLYNDHPPDIKLLETYAADNEYPVDFGEQRFNEIDAKPISANLVADKIAQQDPNDKVLQRTLIRHDAQAVSDQLLTILQSERNI